MPLSQNSILGQSFLKPSGWLISMITSVMAWPCQGFGQFWPHCQHLLAWAATPAQKLSRASSITSTSTGSTRTWAVRRGLRSTGKPPSSSQTFSGSGSRKPWKNSNSCTSVMTTKKSKSGIQDPLVSVFYMMIKYLFNCLTLIQARNKFCWQGPSQDVLLQLQMPIKWQEGCKNLKKLPINLALSNFYI